MEENIVKPDLFGEDIITSERLYELLSEKKLDSLCKEYSQYPFARGFLRRKDRLRPLAYPCDDLLSPQKNGSSRCGQLLTLAVLHHLFPQSRDL